MLSSLQKIGGSQAIILPKQFLRQIGAQDVLEIRLVENTIVLSLPSITRDGWAEAAKAVSAGQDDVLLMDTANCFDEEEWTW